MDAPWLSLADLPLGGFDLYLIADADGVPVGIASPPEIRNLIAEAIIPVSSSFRLHWRAPVIGAPQGHCSP